MKLGDTITFYQIKDKNTGLFSQGGLEPKFKRSGKYWNHLAHVRSHITGLKNHYDYLQKYSPSSPNKKSRAILDMRNWEIVEYKFTKSTESIIPIEQLIIAAGLF